MICLLPLEFIGRETNRWRTGLVISLAYSA